MSRPLLFVLAIYCMLTLSACTSTKPSNSLPAPLDPMTGYDSITYLERLASVHPKDSSAELAALESKWYRHHCNGDARPCIRGLLKLAVAQTSELGADHPHLAWTYDTIAEHYSNAVDHQQAAQWYGKAAQIKELYLGKAAIDTAVARYRRWESLLLAGQPRQVVAEGERALSEIARMAGKHDQAKAILMFHLFRAYMQDSQTENANRIGEQCLALSKISNNVLDFSNILLYDLWLMNNHINNKYAEKFLLELVSADAHGKKASYDLQVAVALLAAEALLQKQSGNIPAISRQILQIQKPLEWGDKTVSAWCYLNLADEAMRSGTPSEADRLAKMAGDCLSAVSADDHYADWISACPCSQHYRLADFYERRGNSVQAKKILGKQLQLKATHHNLLAESLKARANGDRSAAYDQDQMYKQTSGYNGPCMFSAIYGQNFSLPAKQSRSGRTPIGQK